MTPTSVTKARAMLAGLMVGFVACVLLGQFAVHYSKPSGFVRFHREISPETAFYPTFTMLENLALARWTPGKTVVIIGGNSILNGVGQARPELWSLHLQELLGARYVVVNLSFRGANATEGGALVAESLIRRGIPVLYVANGGPGELGRAYDGTYGYLYWQARARDLLLQFPLRDDDRKSREESLPPGNRHAFLEQLLGAQLDAWLCFQELWHHVAYRHFFTVWNSLIPAPVWQPRDQFLDNAPSGQLAEDRFLKVFDTEMRIVRGVSVLLAEPDPQHEWRIEPTTLEATGRDIEATLPTELRPCMLMVLSQNCVYYRERLTPSERARNELVYAAYQELWRNHGITCVTAGGDFSADDYMDRSHLSPSGGQKLAGLVATEIRKFGTP
jgi:hypothetical protein